MQAISARKIADVSTIWSKSDVAKCNILFGDGHVEMVQLDDALRRIETDAKRRGINLPTTLP
jgi:prepilin-type processing-associated H-X9-DG protein